MNKYLKKSTHYIAGDIFNKILLIAFLPIFTYFMIPAEYAVWQSVFANPKWFIILFALIYVVVSYLVRKKVDKSPTEESVSEEKKPE